MNFASLSRWIDRDALAHHIEAERLSGMRLGFPRDGATRDCHALDIAWPAEPALGIALAAFFAWRGSNSSIVVIGVSSARGMHLLEVPAQGNRSINDLRESVMEALAGIDAAPVFESVPTLGVCVCLPDSAPTHIESDLTIKAAQDARTARLLIDAAFDAEVTEIIARQLSACVQNRDENDSRPMAMIRLSNSEEAVLHSARSTGPSAAIADEPVTVSIERQVQSTPDRIALRAADMDWTYAALWAAVERRALWLQSLGARPGVRVGTCLPRSGALWISVLAILRTGAAYVPMDPSHPAARTDEIAADGDVSFVLSSATASAGHRFAGVTVHLIERESTVGAPLCDHPACDDLAYVIYTSGSTGAPKGVMVTHRTLQALFTGLDRALNPNPDTVWLAVTGPTFDPSVPDLVWTLARGHCVAIHETQSAFASDNQSTIADDIVRYGVQRIQCTPSAASIILADPRGPEALAMLDAMQVGGEAISLAMARQIQAHMRPGAQLINIYGPTEITVWISATAIDEGAGPIDIGRPFANARLHVLAPDGGEQAALAPGELWLGGPSLSLGYWRRTEQTRDSFIDDSWARGRLYRTGDIVRRDLDGRIIYLGRKDHQVKVRGQRIELAEVERAVAQALQADAVKVLPRRHGTNATGDTYLEAYFTLPAGTAYEPDAARAAINALLPSSMAPSILVHLDAFPLTPNGKIDRRALLENHSASTPCSHSSARTDEERRLQEIWAQVLGRPMVDVDADFFALGGESLTGARILAEVRAQFGAALGLSAFLQAPSIRKMAALLSTNAHVTGETRVSIAKGSTALRPLYCIHGAGGNVVMFRALAAHLNADRPLDAFQARGVDTDEAPHEDVSAMSESYIKSLRAADPIGPYCLAGFSSGGVIAIDMAQRLEKMGAKVDLVVLFDTLAPWRDEKHVTFFDRIRLAPRASPKVLARWFAERWQRAAPTPAALSATAETEIEQRSRCVTAAMDRATKKWRPTPYEGRVLLYRATQARLSYVAAGPTLGWQSYLNGPLEILTIDADHNGIWEAPAIAEIGRTLEQRLRLIETA